MLNPSSFPSWPGRSGGSCNSVRAHKQNPRLPPTKSASTEFVRPERGRANPLALKSQVSPGRQILHVITWIRFGKSQFLRLLQSRLKAGTGRFHFSQDEITSSVQHARDFIELIPRQTSWIPMMAGIPPATGPRTRCAFLVRGNPPIPARCGNQKFVRQSPPICRSAALFGSTRRQADASNQFHKNVGVRGKHFVDAFRPAHAGGNPIHFFPGNFAIENVGQLKTAVRFLAEQLGDGAADGAETKPERSSTSCWQASASWIPAVFGLRFRAIHFCRQFITSLGTGTGFVFP